MTYKIPAGTEIGIFTNDPRRNIIDITTKSTVDYTLDPSNKNIILEEMPPREIGVTVLKVTFQEVQYYQGRIAYGFCVRLCDTEKVS